MSMKECKNENPAPPTSNFVPHREQQLPLSLLPQQIIINNNNHYLQPPTTIPALPRLDPPTQLQNRHLNLRRLLLLLPLLRRHLQSNVLPRRPIPDIPNIPPILHRRTDPSPQPIMHSAIELLLARPEARTHALLEPTDLQLLPQLIASVSRGHSGDERVHQVEVRGEVVGRFPLDAADVRCGGHGGPVAREVEASVVVRCGWWMLQAGVVERDDVEVVQEDPEDLLGDVDDLLAPDAIGTGLVDGGDEAEGLGVFGRGGVAEIGPDGVGSGGEVARWGGGEVAEEEGDDDSARAEFAGAFLLLVEKHAEQGGEETGLDLGEALEREVGRAEGFQAQ